MLEDVQQSQRGKEYVTKETNGGQWSRRTIFLNYWPILEKEPHLLTGEQHLINTLCHAFKEASN